MELYKKLKDNNGSIHLKTKEEVDQLFSEMQDLNVSVDKNLDFNIRMAIQKVKLQQYYEVKLEEYKSLSHNPVIKSEISEPPVATRAVEKKKTKRKKRKKTSLELHDEWAKSKTKEEIIAINKARVAQYHPEPDFSKNSTLVYKSRRKIEFEKEMKEKNKNRWVSVVSVPMGGQNKK